MCCDPQYVPSPWACFQGAVLNNFKSPIKYCMGFMLLCHIKYKEPGSAKHDAQKILGEASMWNTERRTSFISNGFTAQVLISNFPVPKLRTVWSLDESLHCSPPWEIRTAQIECGTVSLEEGTEGTPLLPSEVSREGSLLKLPSNICEDTELQPASWAGPAAKGWDALGARNHP